MPAAGNVALVPNLTSEEAERIDAQGEGGALALKELRAQLAVRFGFLPAC